MTANSRMLSFSSGAEVRVGLASAKRALVPQCLRPVREPVVRSCVVSMAINPQWRQKLVGLRWAPAAGGVGLQW